jgi:hypothetical protein
LLLVLVDLPLQVPLYFMELVSTVDTDVTWLAAEIACHEDGSEVVVSVKLEVDVLVGLQGIWVLLSCVEETLSAQ